MSSSADAAAPPGHVQQRGVAVWGASRGRHCWLGAPQRPAQVGAPSQDCVKWCRAIRQCGVAISLVSTLLPPPDVSCRLPARHRLPPQKQALGAGAALPDRAGLLPGDHHRLCGARGLLHRLDSHVLQGEKSEEGRRAAGSAFHSGGCRAPQASPAARLSSSLCRAPPCRRAWMRGSRAWCCPPSSGATAPRRCDAQDSQVRERVRVQAAHLRLGQTCSLRAASAADRWTPPRLPPLPPQIPGGWAAQRYGGERVLAWSFALWSLGSLLTPGTAASPRAMAAVRVGVGLAQVGGWERPVWRRRALPVQGSAGAGGLPVRAALPFPPLPAPLPPPKHTHAPVSAARTHILLSPQGFLIPAVHTVLAAWVPPVERARAVSLTTSGLYLGSAAAMLALPTVVARLGPAALIRLVGGLGLAWLGVWRLTLRRVRRQVAASSMPPPGGARPNGGASPATKGRPAATPWRALLTCPAGGCAACAGCSKRAGAGAPLAPAPLSLRP